MVGLDFSNKNVVITGGNGGIGTPVVRGVLEGGGNVILTARRNIDDFTSALNEEFGEGRVKSVIMDMAEPESIRGGYAKIIEETGKIDVLINVAGIVSTASFSELSQEEWDRTIAVNLTALYVGCQVMFNHMKEKGGGRIVNVSSVAGKIGGGLLGTAAYAASKAGVNALTIVYVSHRLDEVFEISDRVSVFRNGQWIKTMNTCDTDKNELIKLMVGRDIGSTYPERNSKIGDVVLEAKNIVAEGVKNVSFSVRAGEVLGIGGLVGSGRSELVNTIFGAQKMQSGEIFIKGKKVDINSPSKAIENGIGLIPEDRKLHGLMLEKDVGFNLSICILETISKYCVVDFKTEEQKQREIIERLRIKLPHAGVLAKTLSGGNQQKVVLAKWLLAEADVLIFDEPTRGVDVGAKQEIYQLINELTDKGMAVIMVSSDMEELMGVPDRIIVLHEGECTGGLDKKDFSQVEILKLASGIQEKTS